MPRIRPAKSLLVAATAAAALLAAAPAQADDDVIGRCVRTGGSVYWEICVNERGCTVYWWASMPPAICL